MKNIVYLNGSYLPQDQATISVMDRGFLFGDSVYEVVPVFNNRLVGVDEHLARLERSLTAIYMTMPLDKNSFKKIFQTLLEKNNLHGDAKIYLQITRGASEERNHHIPRDCQPTVFVCATAAHVPSYTELAKGFKAITLEDSRRRDCFIKSTCLLPNVLAQYQAEQNGALEAIFIRNGYVSEATSSNVVMVKDEIIITPPQKPEILPGITRSTILKLAHTNNIAHQEREIEKEELETADEIWVTGSTKEICPIIILNERPVGTGETGPVWHELVGLYYQYRNHGSANSTQGEATL